MAENPPQITEGSLNQSNLVGHPFKPLPPSPVSNDPEIPQDGIQKHTENAVDIYKDQNEIINVPNIKKSTIFGSTFMITNICLGTTIFTFAVRAKSFGLFWMLFFCFLIAIINYWSIMRCVYSSSRCKFDDYSEITEHFLGKRADFDGRIILPIFLV